MEFIRLLMLFIHLIGFALLLGGWAAAYFGGKLKINGPMLWGTAIQVASGVILSAPMPRDVDPAPAKLVVKALLAVALAVMVWVPHMKKRDPVNKGHFLTIGGLTVITAAVAVFW